MVNNFKNIIKDNVVDEIRQKFESRDKRKSRKNRILARALMEEFLDNHPAVALYIRDDMMNIYLHNGKKALPVDAIDMDSYNLLAELDIQSEYPIENNILGRRKWNSKNYRYHLRDNGNFYIERK